MIQKSQLVAAGIDTSKNAYLGRLNYLVDYYNSLGNAGNAKLRIEALDTIMLIASEYLTSKRPKAHKVTNTARWAALTDLAAQCAQEAQNLGAKQLTSPTDFRHIKGDPKHASQCYWLERMDPMRRPGFTLSALYEEWLTLGGVLDFWTYIGNRGIDTVGQFDPKASNPNKTAQVKLLDDSQKVKRMKYLATFNRNGSLRNIHDEPFCTWNMHTAASGDNWGIFVVSLEGQLYIHSHKVGRFHHSTFMGGAAVAAAGEIVVDEAGVIRVITAKTGHYRASIAEMTKMVTMLPIDSETLILPDLTKTLEPPKGENKALFYRVGDFRVKGANAKPLGKLMVNMRVPTWAKTPEATKRIFSKIP